jgi:hypothetical protein
MKKTILTFLMVTFVISTAFAGPFGLSKGMSVEQISKLSEKGFEPERVSDDTYFFIPKNKIEIFKAYVAYVDEKKGLYRINAISEGINTSAYGIELKNLFNVMVQGLSKTYGTPEITDTVKEDYEFKEGRYWFRSLQDEARELSATWKNGKKGTTLPKELDSISMYVSANFLYGLINIDYYFSNSAEIQGK